VARLYPDLALRAAFPRQSRMLSLSTCSTAWSGIVLC
jgi:hypothetical protein